VVVCDDQRHGQAQQESGRDVTIAGIEKPDGSQESGEDRHVPRRETAVVSPAVEPVEVVAPLVYKPDPRVDPSENQLAEPFQEIGERDGAAGKSGKPRLIVDDPPLSEDEVVAPEKGAANTDQQEKNIRNFRDAGLQKVAGF